MPVPVVVVEDRPCAVRAACERRAKAVDGKESEE